MARMSWADVGAEAEPFPDLGNATIRDINERDARTAGRSLTGVTGSGAAMRVVMGADSF
jgi:hypothetical protein